jgi:hypothetical protein
MLGSVKRGIDRELLVIAQAGTADAEVIDCQLRPYGFECNERQGSGPGILHEDAFGQLQLEVAGSLERGGKQFPL